METPVPILPVEFRIETEEPEAGERPSVQAVSAPVVPVQTAPVVKLAVQTISGTQAVDPWKLSTEEEPHFRRRRNAGEAFGRYTAVVPDKSARLIPNATGSLPLERYRRLRTKLVHQHTTQPFKSLVVTSANPQEGKTVTTLNLAMSFAMLSNFRIVVIDADLRRGSVTKWVGGHSLPGFSDLIEGTATLEEVALYSDEVPFHFIVSGTSKKQPAELLHSTDLSKNIRNLSEQFDLVLIDSPPINLLTDTHLIAAASDAVLLVARAFTTSTKGPRNCRPGTPGGTYSRNCPERWK